MKVAVIGAGIMGSGIGQAAAMAGHDVAVRDVSESQLEGGRSSIETSLARFVKSGKLTQEQATAAQRRLELTADLGRAVEGAEVVIEAVPEVLQLKQDVFREVVELAPKGALLGTNTSQLSITSIGSAIGAEASRLVGMHFFNPPVLMKLVELVRGLRTSEESTERARSFATGLGKQVVVCQKDTPGFLTSRVSAIVRLECLRMLEEGLASAEDIDTAVKVGFNWPMGPLELGDFNGLDTYLHALESLEAVHGDRFKPTPLLRNLVAAGALGRKTGEGFYRYGPEGQRRS